jgi:hypothetical protein
MHYEQKWIKKEGRKESKIDRKKQTMDGSKEGKKY